MIGSMRLWIIRSTAFKAMPILVGVGLLAVFSRGTPWMGEWRWTIDWINGTTILVGPLVAGLAAFDLYRLGSPGWLGLTRSARRGWATPICVMLTVAASGVCAFGLAAAVAVALTASTAPGGRAPLGALALGALVIVGFVGVGGLIGTFWPSLLSAPVSVIVAFGLTQMSGNTIPMLFRVGGSTGSMAGFEFDPRVILGVAAFHLTFALGACAIAAMRHFGLQIAWAGAAAAGVIMAGAAYATLSTMGDDRARVSSSVTQYACAGSLPEVCMVAETQRQLDSLANEMRNQATFLRNIGVVLPRRYYQEIPGRQAPSGGGVFALMPSAVNAPTADPYLVASYLLVPARCPQYYGTSQVDVSAALQAMYVIGEWLRSQAIPGYVVDHRSPIGRWLNGSPEEARHEWIRSTFSALSACRLSEVRAPVQREG